MSPDLPRLRVPPMLHPPADASLSAAPTLAAAALAAAAAPPPPPTTTVGAADADVVFATFWVAPGQAPEDYESLRPDMRFAEILRRSHAGRRVHIAVLTDRESNLDGLAPDVEIFRCGAIERARLGRNSYCNYAQFVAQIDYLKRLQVEAEAAGKQTPGVVFLDTDILVVRDVAGPLFFDPAMPAADYYCTVSDEPSMPINLGWQCVRPGGAARAVAFLEGVIEVYDFGGTFVAGQEAIATFGGLLNDAAAVESARLQASREGYALRTTACGRFSCLYLPCVKYNFCVCDQSCCVDPARGSEFIPRTPAELAENVHVFHLVGHRKPGFDVGYLAYMQGGLAALYIAMAALPHKEADYLATFGAARSDGKKADAIARAAADAVAAASAAERAAKAARGGSAGPATPPGGADDGVRRSESAASMMVG